MKFPGETQEHGKLYLFCSDISSRDSSFPTWPYEKLTCCVSEIVKVQKMIHTLDVVHDLFIRHCAILAKTHLQIVEIYSCIQYIFIRHPSPV